MAKVRSLIVGVGCLLVLLGSAIVVLVALGMQGPPLGKRMVLAIRLDRPVVEVAADDPFAELSGGAPVALRDLRRALVRAAEDDRVVGLRLRLDDYAGGVGTAQEIRWSIGRLRDAGKWSAAYMDSAGEFMPGNFTYYVAAACDSVSLHPMGDLNLIGLSLRFPFLGGTFDKLGIRAEYPGRGDYKDMRFQYTRRDFSPAQLEMIRWLGESWTDQLVEDIGSSRGILPDDVRVLIDRGPYLGDEAVSAGLVDRLEDWPAFADRVAEQAADAQVVGLHTYLKRGLRPAAGPRIAVVSAIGLILRGESGTSINPMMSGPIMGTETIARAFRNARRTSGVKAVVFRIDSPGGTPLASEIIRREMVRTAEQLPVVVSIANLGASGGYWIACGAQRIVANPGAQIGSIGVAAGHLNLDPFLSEKLGITFGRLDLGANANIYSTFEDWTDPQRAVIERLLDRTYGEFLGHVSEARGMTREQVDALGQGRVFTGRQGLANGLVDVIGGLDAAIAEARGLAGIPPEATVQLVELPKVVPWWQLLIGRRTRDDEVVRELAAAAAEIWRTGVVRSPGLVWTPPIFVE